MVDEVYLMKGDTLFKTLIEAYNGALDTIIVDTHNGRGRLEARMFAKKRAELVAKVAVAAEVMRWRLKHEDLRTQPFSLIPIDDNFLIPLFAGAQHHETFPRIG
jgi:hypothetical protein